MSLLPAQPRAARFGPFDLDLRTGELDKNGLKVPLSDQPRQILVMLLEQAGEVVTRDELRKRVWPEDTFVDFDHGLNNSINRLRELLSDSAKQPRFIETLPRRGYRFVASVEWLPPAERLAQTAGMQEPRTPEPATIEKRGSRRFIAAGITALALALLSIAILPDAGGLRARLFGNDGAPIRSIAVLQLKNLSGSPDQDYFAEGLTDELTTNLARVKALRVVSATSVREYRGSPPTLRQVARDLNVDAVVEGSVVRSGSRIRITAQLIDARTDTHLWAQSYERDVGEVLEIQDSVAREIAFQVRANLTPAERDSFDVRRTVIPEAYDAYLRGRVELGGQRQEALRKGLEDFQRAIALDRLYAPAYAGLADSYSLLANYGAMPPKEAFPKATSAALKALELDHNLAEAHTALAFVKHHFDLDWTGAEAEYRQSIQLDPSNAITHLRYAEYLSNVARHDEAIRQIRLAHDIAPRSLVIQGNIGRVLYHARRYDEAISELRALLAADPHRVYARTHLAMSLEQRHMYAEAATEFETIKKEFNGADGIGVAHLHASMSKVQDARRILAIQEAPAPDGVQDWFWIAGVYAQLGEKDKAFHWLDQAFENHDFFLTYLKVHPYMDPLRSDPRFAKLLRRMAFPPS